MQDRFWGRRAWEDPHATSRYAPQPGSAEEAKTVDALTAVRESVEEVQLHRSPGLDDPRLARDLGLFWTGARMAIGIRDVLGQPRTDSYDSYDFSGSPAGFTATLRSAQGSVFG